MPNTLANLPGGALSGAGAQGSGLVGGAGSTAPGALTPGNVQYNGNQANQQAMDTFNKNSQMGDINQFMNPYVNDVVNANTEQSWRNFNQQQAPALQSAFGGSGQFGSARGMQSMEQASRDNAQQTNWQNSQLMNTGFQDAMKNMQNQQAQNINAANGMTTAGTAANNMSNSQQLLPYDIMARMAASQAALRPESGTITNGASSQGWVW